MHPGLRLAAPSALDKLLALHVWTETQRWLLAEMVEAFDAVLATAKKHDVDMRTAAYIVAINRVATVTRMRGMYA